MLCINPFKVGKMQFGCSRCLPCLVNRRRQWTGRIVLESYLHASSAFVTLTYAGAAWSLIPEDLKLYIKRLRVAVDVPVRYFAVGEYGDKSWRPHYHLALFGIGLDQRDFILDSWRYGNVHIGELNPVSAHYICGYVCKRMNWEREALQGRFPEFARMSRGLGAGAMTAVANGLTTDKGSTALASMFDVPGEVRIDGKLFPVGRYLKGRLREEVGGDKQVPEAFKAFLRAKEELMTVEEKALREEKREGDYNTAHARFKIQNSKRGL